MIVLVNVPNFNFEIACSSGSSLAVVLGCKIRRIREVPSSPAATSCLEGGRRKWRRILKINNSVGGYERSNTRLNDGAGWWLLLQYNLASRNCYCLPNENREDVHHIFNLASHYLPPLPVTLPPVFSTPKNFVFGVENYLQRKVILLYHTLSFVLTYSRLVHTA